MMAHRSDFIASLTFTGAGAVTTFSPSFLDFLFAFLSALTTAAAAGGADLEALAILKVYGYDVF